LPRSPPLLPESALAASWMHTMLFILEIILAIRYISKFNGHRRFNLLVGFLVANGIVTVIATCAHAWKLIIRQATPPTKHSWPLPVMIICKNITGVIAQCFLVYRYYGLSRSIFITALVVLVIVVSAGAGLTFGIDYLVHPQFGSPIAAMARPISFCINAAIDLIIPLLLIYELRKIKPIYSSTQSFIRRLMVNAASSGCCVALAEILVLVFLWTQPQIILLGCYILAPLYGITVLVNLFVCRSSVPAMQTKTANLTTLDSVQIPGSIDPLDYYGNLDGTGNQSMDCSATNSPWSEKS